MTTANIPPEIAEYLGSLPADTRAALADQLRPNPQAEAAAAMRAMRAGDIGSPADADMGSRPSIFGDNDDDSGLTRRERAANAIRDFFSRGDRAPSDPEVAVDALAAQGFDNITHDPTGAHY